MGAQAPMEPQRSPLPGTPIGARSGASNCGFQVQLGRELFEAAVGPKRFVLDDGGSRHNTNAIGQALYREAISQLFGLR
jgi:hypothetical protein